MQGHHTARPVCNRERARIRGGSHTRVHVRINAKMDYTPYPIENRQGYVWACMGDDAVSITVARTRAQAVLYKYYPHWDTPITCDGYSGYSQFRIRQVLVSHTARIRRSLGWRSGNADTAPKTVATVLRGKACYPGYREC